MIYFSGFVEDGHLGLFTGTGIRFERVVARPETYVDTHRLGRFGNHRV